MSNIFPIDFEEKLTMAQDDYILFSDSEDGNKIKKAQYKNLKGEPGTPGTPGKDGKDGTDGAAATITVGSTTTGAAGSSASVTNSGTSSAAVLDFTIPQGAKGEPGEDGQDGADGVSATITVGTTTTLPAGSSATVTNVGTSQDAILNFGIPKGDSGSGSGDVNGPASSTDGDVAVFDGATGKLIKDSGASLADYQEKLTAGTNIQISNNVISATGGSDIVYATQAEYNALLPGAESDGKHYFIYSTSGGGGWTPDASRTIFYYDFEQNLDDSSGNNHNMTSGSNYTYESVGGQYVVQDSGNIDLNIPSGLLTGIGTGDFTLAFWLYPIVPTNVANRQPIMFGLTASTTPYPGPCMFFDYYGSGDPDGGLTNPDSEIIWRTARGTHTVGGVCANYINGWHHFVMTRNSGVVDCYIDATSVAQYNSSTNIGSTNRGYFIGSAANRGPQGWGTSGAKGDKLIFENVGWSSQDVSDYFDQTKSTYGIS